MATDRSDVKIRQSRTADDRIDRVVAGCRTHSFSSLEYVVALPGVIVNRNAELSNCVIDRGVLIPEGMVVGKDPEEDAKWFRRTESGIVLVTQNMVDARTRALG